MGKEIDAGNLKPFLEHWQPVVNQYFETQKAKDDFITRVGRVLDTNCQAQYFYNIYVPRECGGKRVLETFLFMSKRKGNTVKILCSYFAKMDEVDQSTKWI